MPNNPRNASEATSLWHVPYPLNPFFTGRARTLNDLRTALTHANTVALTQAKALRGLDGVGKTETAVAYAYRFREEYQAVFWVRADSEWTAIQDFLGIAALLGIESERTRFWARAVHGVRSWLEEHADWLLILDNLEQPKKFKDWLPPTPTGHLLVTSHTNTPTTVIAGDVVELGELLQEEAVRFLYKRTGRLDNDSLERKAAFDLVVRLGCLPLALEHAGAFLAAKNVGARDYLLQLKRQPNREQTKSLTGESLREAVSSTLSIAMDDLQKEAPLSIELLRASAFLGLERIPFDLFISAGDELEPELSLALGRAADHSQGLDELLEPLARYGLIRLDRDGRCFSVPLSIGKIVRAGLDQDTRERLANRAVQVVHRHFALSNDEPNPGHNEVLPQAHAMMQLVQEGLITSLEVGQQLRRFGLLIELQIGFSAAESLFRGALAIFESALGNTHPDVLSLMHDLACRYAAEKRQRETDHFFKRSLAAREQSLGSNHIDLAVYLHDMARQYDEEGRHGQADKFFNRSLAIREKNLGHHHPDLAVYIDEIGRRYASLGRYSEAEESFKRSLALFEEAYGRSHPEVARRLHDLACWYTDQARYQEAEPLFKRALLIARNELPSDDPAMGTYLNSLARFYHTLRKYRYAEPLYKEAIAHKERNNHPELAAALNNLASLYHERGKYAAAEPLMKRSLALVKQALPPEHPDLAICLNNLAALYFARRKYDEAEPLYQQALPIRERHLPPDHPDLIPTLENYASLLRKLKRTSEAEALQARVTDIRGKDKAEKS